MGTACVGYDRILIMQLEFSDNFSSPTLGAAWSVYDCTGVAGATASIVSGQLQLHGSGTDIWESGVDYQDKYIACYLTQTVRGDFDAIVQITSQSNIGETWSKAGIMVRNDMQQSGSSTGYCVVASTPGSGFTFQWDSNNNGYLDSNQETTATALPTYFKMSRRGYRFTGHSSTDKINWSPVYYADLASANASVNVGLFNSAHNATAANTTLMDGFELWTGKTRFFSLF